MLKYIVGAFLILYGFLNFIALIASKQQQKTWRVILYGIGAGLLIGAAVFMFYSKALGLICCACGLGVYISCAIYNGYKLYGKPHWSHHIVRFIFSILVSVIYWFV